MDPLLAAAAWFILWWLCFFVMLPIGVKNLEEEGEMAPGLEKGAPARPNLGKKALWAAGLATGLWIALILVLNAVYYDR
jgi:predicted secreted protein